MSVAGDPEPRSHPSDPAPIITHYIDATDLFSPGTFHHDIKDDDDDQSDARRPFHLIWKISTEYLPYPVLVFYQMSSQASAIRPRN